MDDRRLYLTGGPEGRMRQQPSPWRSVGLLIISALFLLTGLMAVLPKRAALWLSRIVAFLGTLLIIALAISLRT